MTTETHALILDLVEWVAARPRPYAEAMEVWRTSCPGLTIREDAVDQGFVVCERGGGMGTMVTVTPSGRDLLGEAGRSPNAAEP